MTNDPQANLGSSGETSTAADGRSRDPRTVGPYMIERKIGAGGMGTVYLARDPRHKRLVALKVLKAERADNPTLVRRFQAEAKTASALTHDNIVAVYDAGQADGFTYLAMEFVDGIDVHDLVQRREVIPVKRSIDIVKQVLDALQHAYVRGVVHRDIKPSNLLITRDGTVKLADLGLARLVDETSDAGITRDGTTVGTIDYMSPEQARHSRLADVRSDIYSLGCTWYHMLTGEPPFPEGGLTERLRLHAQGAPPDPRNINPRVPEGVVAILNRMMAKKPDDRYATPAEVLEDIEKVRGTGRVVSHEILAKLDDSPGKEPSSGARPRPAASTIPARDPRLAAPESQPSMVLPVRLIGTVVAIIAVIALFIFVLRPMLSGDPAEPNNIDYTAEPVDPFDPFAAPAAAPQDPNVDNPGDQQAPDGDGNRAPPDETIDSAAHAPPTTDALAKTEPAPVPRRDITPSDKDDLHRQYLPDWALRPGEGNGAHNPLTATATLTAAAGGADQPVGLAGLIEELPPAGGIIELPGAGPYELNLTQLRDRRQVALRGSGDRTVRPAVFLRQQGGNDPLLDAGTEVLELSGLDLFVEVESAAAEPLVAIRLGQGNLMIRDCSLQVTGQTSRPVIGWRVDDPGGAAGSPTTRVLIDRTVCLGPNLTAASIDAGSADVVVRDSLLATGNEPAIRLDQSRTAAASSRRDLRMIGSTIVSQRSAVELVNGQSFGDVAATWIIGIDCIFANPQSSQPASLLSAVNWPAEDGRLTRLNWESAGSAYQGWPVLIQNRTPTGMDVIARDVNRWQSLWASPGEPAQFDSAAWSAAAVGGDEVSLRSFAPSQLPNANAVSLSGGRPGCRVGELHLGRIASSDTVIVAPPRPSVPEAGGAAFKGAERMTVDLTKQDLGRFFRTAAVPDRVIIVAEGHGLRTVSPFTLNDKMVRIEFRQTPGETPLKLAPTAFDNSRDPEAAAALITVSGGRLELAEGRFDLPAGKQQQGLKWLLDVRRGGFSVEHCQITATPGGTLDGLIRWDQDGADGSSRASVVRDSYLVGGGTLLHAQLAGRQLVVDNAILATPDTIFSVAANGAEGKTGGAVLVRQSTLSAGRTFFQIASVNDSQAASPLAIYAEQTVFGGPLHDSDRASPPAVIAAGEQADLGWRVQWFGLRNGFSDEIVPLAAAAPSGADASLASDWLDLWGGDHVQSPLTERGGVLFAAPLPTINKLSPERFKLLPSAAASTWGEGQQPLGADVEAIDASSAQKRRRGAEPRRSKGF